MDWIKHNSRGNDGETEPSAWADVSRELARLTELIQAAGPIPESVKPWKVIESLEATGRALLKRARQLRKQNGL